MHQSVLFDVKFVATGWTNLARCWSIKDGTQDSLVVVPFPVRIIPLRPRVRYFENYWGKQVQNHNNMQVYFICQI